MSKCISSSAEKSLKAVPFTVPIPSYLWGDQILLILLEREKTKSLAPITVFATDIQMPFYGSNKSWSLLVLISHKE